jgi:hypothetical protein
MARNISDQGVCFRRFFPIPVIHRTRIPHYAHYYRLGTSTWRSVNESSYSISFTSISREQASLRSSVISFATMIPLADLADSRFCSTHPIYRRSWPITRSYPCRLRLPDGLGELGLWTDDSIQLLSDLAGDSARPSGADLAHADKVFAFFLSEVERGNAAQYRFRRASLATLACARFAGACACRHSPEEVKGVVDKSALPAGG